MIKKNYTGLAQRLSRTATQLLLPVCLSLAASSAYAHNPHDPVSALGISPDYANDRTLFMSGFPESNWGYHDILRSTNGGKTWRKLPKGVDNRFQFSVIRVSPSYSLDQTVFAATLGDGVYQTTNKGASWQLFNTGLPNLVAEELEIAGPSNTNYVLFLAPRNGGLYRRAINQSTWTQVLPSPTSIKVIATSPDFTRDLTVMTADATGRLRLSSDGGHTWIDKGKPSTATIQDLAIAPGGAKEIFLTTSDNSLLYSQDSGTTFVKKDSGLPNEGLNNLAVSHNYLVDKTVFCTSALHAVYKSVNAGSSWVLFSSGAEITGQASAGNEFSDLQLTNTFATDGTIFLSAFDGLFRSINGGTTWSEIETRTTLTTGLAFSPKFITDRRMLASSYSGGGMYASSDSGTTWQRAVNGWGNTTLAPQSFFDVEFVPNHIGPPMAVAIQNYSDVGFTSNFGASWTVAPIANVVNSLPGEVYPTVIGISPTFDTDQTMFLGTRNHGVIRTLDSGQTWRAMSDVPTGVITTSVAVSPNYAQDKTAFAATLHGQVWRTSNGGESWIQLGASSIVLRPGTSFNKFTWVALSPRFGTDKLVLVGTNNGVYRSIDGGNTWNILERTDVGLSTVIQQIEFSPNFNLDRSVFVTVRGKGLYSLTLTATGAVSSISNVGLSLLNKNVAFSEFRFSPSYKKDGTIMGGSRGSIYRSTDRGLTWALAGTTPGL